jgi:hypothetical protein
LVPIAGEPHRRPPAHDASRGSTGHHRAIPHLDDGPDDFDDVGVITVVSPLKMDDTAVGCPMSNRRRWQKGQLLLLTANSTELLATNIAGDASRRESRHTPPPFCPRALDESNWIRGDGGGRIHRGTDA